jgi:hypothetical protein
MLSLARGDLVGMTAGVDLWITHVKSDIWGPGTAANRPAIWVQERLISRMGIAGIEIHPFSLAVYTTVLRTCCCLANCQHSIV